MTGPASAAATAPPAIEAVGIVKSFPGVRANDHVDFDLRPGEIHALLGENGAGKSTLMNVLAGLYRPDEGRMRVGGQDVEFRSPRDAIAAGIGMVHQHFTLVPSQTVAENVLLGLDTPRFRLDLRKTEKEVARLASDVGLRVDPGASVWQLSVGEQQRVEIIKLLYHGASVLILDEPTAVLAPQEIAELFTTLRSMVGGGRSVVFISHKLGEVLSIADRITVMRGGVVTAAGIDPSTVTRADLARLMVGRPVLEQLQRTQVEPGRVVLHVDDVNAESDRRLPALRGASLEVHAGEIVGVAAVAGNGQSELAQVITGLRTCTGRVTIDGREVGARPSREAITAGVAHVHIRTSSFPPMRRGGAWIAFDLQAIRLGDPRRDLVECPGLPLPVGELACEPWVALLQRERVDRPRFAQRRVEVACEPRRLCSRRVHMAEALQVAARPGPGEGRVKRALVGVTAAGAQAPERDVGGDLGHRGGACGEHVGGERAAVFPAPLVHEHQGEPRARVGRVQVLLLGERDVIAQRALRAVELVHLPKTPAQHPVPVGDAMLELA